MANGESWEVSFWEPRETGPFDDLNIGTELWLGVTVNELETRIYIATPNGKFDCLYLDYGLKSTFSSMYKKMSEWSLPKSKQMNLFTLNEEDHDFLMDDVDDTEEEEDNFDDVVDEIIQ